jgi:hypothetical protein
MMVLDNNAFYVQHKNVWLFQQQFYELKHNKVLIDDEVHSHPEFHYLMIKFYKKNKNLIQRNLILCTYFNSTVSRKTSATCPIDTSLHSLNQSILVQLSKAGCKRQISRNLLPAGENDRIT